MLEPKFLAKLDDPDHLVMRHMHRLPDEFKPRLVLQKLKPRQARVAPGVMLYWCQTDPCPICGLVGHGPLL